jgi:hypothetical protein
MADTNQPGVGALLNAAAYFNASRAAGEAGDQAAAGTTNAINAVNNIYGQTSSLTLPFIQQGAALTNQVIAGAQPYQQAGVAGLKALQQQQTPLDVQKYYDPSMQFTMDQGQRALQASAAARGGVLSGAALKDINQYASGLASQNYQSAVQNAMADRQQQIGVGQSLMQGGLGTQNTLAGLSGQGISALDIQGRQAAATASDIGTLNQALGQQQSNATNQRAAQVGQAINQLGNWVTNPSTGGSDAAITSDVRAKSEVEDVGSAPRGAFMHHLFGPARTQPQPETMKSNEVQQTLDGLQAKTFQYTPEAQAQMGAPAGKQIGILAQDLEKTPAKGMVNQGPVKTIDTKKATSFALAALSELNKRVNNLEGKK